MKSLKKKHITLIALAGVLAVLILLYFLVIAPLMNENDDDPDEPVYVAEGEGLYYKMLLMYPKIESKDAISVTITNEHGTASFKNVINEDSAKKEFVLADYPTVKLNDINRSFLSVVTLNPQCFSNTPLRDCSPEMMASYGVTRETCKISYVVKYYENDVEKQHTVYVGDKTLSSNGTYFASVEGRNVIYEISSSLENCLTLAKEDFVSPTISESENADIIYNIERIMLGHSGDANPFIGIGATKYALEDSLTIKYTMKFPLKAKNVSANTNFTTTVMTNMLTSFVGDKVVAINPDEQTLEKYGLGEGAVKKYITFTEFSTTGDNGEQYTGAQYSFVISLVQDGEDGNKYYYTVTPPRSAKDAPLLVRFPAKGYEFLEEENSIKWVATNSVESGFSKYINADEGIGESGVKDMTIISNTEALSGFSDKFILNRLPHPSREGETILSVTSESGRYTFTDNIEATLSEDRNQFNMFYAMLVNYPMPSRFNTMSAEEKQAVKAQGKLLFSMEVTLNNGAVLKYDYYEIDAANVMCEFVDEKNTEPTIVFDTTREQINIIATALRQLISGEKVEQK